MVTAYPEAGRATPRDFSQMTLAEQQAIIEEIERRHVINGASLPDNFRSSVALEIHIRNYCANL